MNNNPTQREKREIVDKERSRIKTKIEKDYFILNNGCLIRKDRLKEGGVECNYETVRSLEELLKL